MKLVLCLALVSVPLILAQEDYRKRDYHINSIGYDGPFSGGCRKKHPENRSLPGGAEACHSHKPLKIKGISKMGKRLCGEGFEYCSMSHKALHHLSWKTDEMPKSCFAFHYKKDKFAGYGHNCHRNLYFDGLLCCPKVSSKTALKIGSNDKVYQKRRYTNETFLRK